MDLRLLEPAVQKCRFRSTYSIKGCIKQPDPAAVKDAAEPLDFVLVWQSAPPFELLYAMRTLIMLMCAKVVGFTKSSRRIWDITNSSFDINHVFEELMKNSYTKSQRFSSYLTAVIKSV